MARVATAVRVGKAGPHLAVPRCDKRVGAGRGLWIPAAARMTGHSEKDLVGGVSAPLVHVIIGFVPLGRGGGIGRHAVLRGPWAFACAGSNPALGTNLRDSARRGDVAKWLRRRSAKPLFGGSNPPVASIKCKQANANKLGYSPGATPAPQSSGKVGGALLRRRPGVSAPSLTGITFPTNPPKLQPARLLLLV